MDASSPPHPVYTPNYIFAFLISSRCVLTKALWASLNTEKKMNHKNTSAHALTYDRAGHKVWIYPSDPMLLAVALIWVEVSAFHERQLSLKNKQFEFISLWMSKIYIRLSNQTSWLSGELIHVVGHVRFHFSSCAQKHTDSQQNTVSIPEVTPPWRDGLSWFHG